MEKLSLIKNKRSVFFSLSFLLTAYLFARPTFAFEFEPIFSVNNFSLFTHDPLTDKRYFINFNRLRADLTLSNDWLKFHLIADNENYRSEKKIVYLSTPGENLPVDIHHDVFTDSKWINRFYLYRAYTQAEVLNSTVSLGLQRVPFGVGRLWTPTDTFNPLNSVSLEPGEREGILGAIWTMYFGDFTRIMAVTAADDEWNAGKNSLHIKSFIFNMDMGATYVHSKDFQMAGYEIESNFFKTGAEIRSEGGYFFDINNEDDFFKGILGLDRSFGEKFFAALEYLYNSAGESDKKRYPLFPKDPLLFGNLARHYIGAILNYLPDPLLTLSLATTINLNDSSFFLSPSVSYSFSDNGTLSTGALLFEGQNGAEYGSLEPTYFLRIDWFF